MNTTLIIAILSPILLTTGGIISWLIKAKREDSLNEEAKSREFKIETYKKLLEPFIATLTFTLPDKQKEKEINKITSLEYRKTVFDMTTFGSDQALKIFSQIMQTFFHSEKYKEENGEYSEEYGIRLLALISELLLQIRKDIYSSKTKLDRADMIEFMITDIEETREKINKYAC
uniref:hypothetical protein n=1 Tax=Fulvivirga sp. TaxID=1931237 RepID=UPI00404925DA